MKIRPLPKKRKNTWPLKAGSRPRPRKAASWPSPGPDFKPEAARAKDLPKLAGFYSQHISGHHQTMYNILQGCCRIVKELASDKKQFGLLRSHPFFVDFKRKPPPEHTAKWVVYLVTGAKSARKRDRACKYAKIISALKEEGIDVDEVASEIERRGGIEKTYRNITKKISVENENRNVEGSNEVLDPDTDRSSDDNSREQESKVQLGPRIRKAGFSVTTTTLMVTVTAEQMKDALGSKTFEMTGVVSDSDNDDWKNVRATRLRAKTKA